VIREPGFTLLELKRADHPPLVCSACDSSSSVQRRPRYSSPTPLRHDTLTDGELTADGFYEQRCWDRLPSVARGDGAAAGSSPLTRYYLESGTPPGRFLGAGLVGFDGGRGIPPGTVVQREGQRLTKVAPSARTKVRAPGVSWVRCVRACTT